MNEKPAHKAVELSCVLTGYNRRADKSVSVRLTTLSESPGELIAWLDERHSREVQVFLADDKEAQAVRYRGTKDSKGRSPSQRLRNRLYAEHQTLLDHGRDVPEDFERYYGERMEEIIATL